MLEVVRLELSPKVNQSSADWAAGAIVKPTAMTGGGGVCELAPLCARCCEDGVGTKGEPELSNVEKYILFSTRE